MFAVPLAVRFTTPAADKSVTKGLRDFGFRKQAIGGWASAWFDFDHSVTSTDPTVAPYGSVIVSDGRHGGVIWQGRQEDPGRGADSGGEAWQLQAFGPAAAVDDRRITVCYVDNGIEAWQPSSRGMAAAQVSSLDAEPPVVQVQLPNSTVVATSAFGSAVDRVVADCGQKLARVSAAWSAGVTDAGFSVVIYTHNALTGTLTAAATAAMNVAGGTLTARITSDIPAGDNIAWFSLLHTAAPGTVLDDDHWISGGIVVQGTRYTAAGVEQTAAATYTSDTVLASDIVKDLLGRCLGQFDGANASIDTTSFAIDRLVYPDPTSPSQILDDLMALESDYFWHAGASTSGGYSFTWQAWPTTVQYEAPITGAFSSPGNAGELYNAVLVRYRDRNGRTRHVRRTLAQVDLDAAGITREFDMDLGDEIGSAANANQVGDRFLLDHNSPPNAGTLDVNQPILDLVNARLVAPWEIEPGTLIRVRGVQPRVDALNATDRDGVTVFRIVAVNYTASTNTATLELDSLGRGTADEILAAHRRIDQLRKR